MGRKRRDPLDIGLVDSPQRPAFVLFPPSCLLPRSVSRLPPCVLLLLTCLDACHDLGQPLDGLLVHLKRLGVAAFVVERDGMMGEVESALEQVTGRGSTGVAHCTGGWT
jgi:hypothetical protein